MTEHESTQSPLFSESLQRFRLITAQMKKYPSVYSRVCINNNDRQPIAAMKTAIETKLSSVL